MTTRASYDIAWGMLDKIEELGGEPDENVVRYVKAIADEIASVGAVLTGGKCICRTREIGCPCPQHGYSDEGVRP